jgi:aspartate-semialdehyde dehydrogenase
VRKKKRIKYFIAIETILTWLRNQQTHKTHMKVAVVGATGLVGSKMLQVLAERKFPVTQLIPVATERSLGKTVSFDGKPWAVVTPEMAVELKPDLALFSAGGSTSLQWAPIFAELGCVVIDNSSAWIPQRSW